MTARSRRRGPKKGGVVGALVLTAMVAGCAGSTEAPAPGATESGAVAPSAGVTGAAPSPDAPESCADLLPADVIEEFEGQGWTSREAPFTVGDIAVDGGLYCDWADFSHPSGNVVSVGWAPLDGAAAAELEQQLVDEGWLRDEAAATPIFTDPGGFGLAFELGDGWTSFASPPDALVLIRHP